jgi:hypothetical protein
MLGTTEAGVVRCPAGQQAVSRPPEARVCRNDNRSWVRVTVVHQECGLLFGFDWAARRDVLFHGHPLKFRLTQYHRSAAHIKFNALHRGQQIRQYRNGLKRSSGCLVSSVQFDERRIYL